MWIMTYRRKQTMTTLEVFHRVKHLVQLAHHLHAFIHLACVNSQSGFVGSHRAFFPRSLSLRMI